MALSSFIIDHLFDISLVIIILALFTVLFKLDNRNTIRQVILDLVVQAEKNLGNGTGELKYAYVMSHLHRSIPAFTRFLYPYKEIHKYIEDEVKFLNNLMENGVDLKGYDQEH